MPAEADRCTRSQPFLRRNLARGLEAAQNMGIAASFPKSAPDGAHTDRDGGPPQKRRRLGSTTSTATSAPARAPAPATAKDHTLADQLFLAHEVSSAQRSLRIQVLQLVHKDAKKIKLGDPLSDADNAPRQLLETKARCRVTLTDSSNDLVLNCQSQMCTIKTFKSSAIPYQSVRVWLSRPFHIPEESILVIREDNDRLAFADSYKITVELEGADPGSWPPIDAVSLGGVTNTSQHSPPSRPSRCWVLSGETTQLFGRPRSAVPLRLKKSPQKTVATDYVIDIDARWSTGYEASAIRPLEKGAEPSITVFRDGPPLSPDFTSSHLDNTGVVGAMPPSPMSRTPDDHQPSPRNGGVVNGLDGVDGMNGNMLGDEDDEHGEEMTPNRSRRARKQINYNLKDLSNKAQGKERRRHKRKAFRDHEEGQVVYEIPSQTVQLGAYRCVCCGLAHENLTQLQAHFQLNHAEYDFVVQVAGKEIHIQVAHRYEYHGTDDDAVFQLGSPIKPFNLQRFINGDASWIKSRTGSDMETEGTRKKQKKRGMSPTKPAEKTNGTAAQKLLVPHTKQPLYDPISRLPLEPGTEFVRNEPDDSWLIQWHRDAIDDFSDISPEEREFMTTWDKFMLTQRISSDIYLPYSWLEFVKLKADWLVAAHYRMIEFGKHMSYLNTRNVLNNATIKEAMQVLSAAKVKLKQSGGQPVPLTSKIEEPGRISAADCQVCGRSVLGPRQLFCSNLDCWARCYHSDCVRETSKMDVEDPSWLCDACFATPPGSKRV